MVWWKISFAYLFSIALLLVVVVGPSILLKTTVVAGSDCFFGPHKESLCDMSPLDHLEHWQSTFAATVVKAITLLGLAVVALFVIHKFVCVQRTYRYIRLHSPPQSTLFQELFARGLLNSKAY